MLKLKVLFLEIVMIILSTYAFSYLERKYEILLSVSTNRYLYTDLKYKSETIYSDIFYKHNEVFSFGLEFVGTFGIPVYTYTGYIQEYISSGKILLYSNLLNYRLLDLARIGIMTKLSFNYILDYKDVIFLLEPYSVGDILKDVRYIISLKDIGFGVYSTDFIPFRFTMNTFTILGGLLIYWGNFIFYPITFLDVDVNSFWFVPYLSFLVSYRVDKNFEMGIGNTFRVGNYLNLRFFSKIDFEKIMFDGYAEFGIVNGVSVGIRLISEM
ncbi:MAG: hypothetical protein N2712_01465 [Brevinematales bacterium]|nr:hypothetical protein [Brevinematales bacterium]